MKNLLLSFSALCLLLIASCNNNDGLQGNSTVNGWSFKGNTYYTFSAKFHGDTLTAIDDTIGNYNTISFVFPSVPSASGTYRVISHSSVPAANQMVVFLHTLGTTSYFQSIGNDTSRATVTVTNGRVAVTVPNINLLSSTTSNDTSLVYATVTQTQ